MNEENKKAAFERCLKILDRLRKDCPWDRKQTNESLRSHSIEEVYELSDAIIKNDADEIKKELGDVLLHIIFYAKIAEEKEQFDIADVCNALCDKLIYRHPHVFGEINADNADQVMHNWEELKLHENKNKAPRSVLSGVPSSLPSLIKAYRIQDKAANVGFDWQKPSDVWAKVKEEISEFSDEIENMDKKAMEEEFGDVMFSLVNVARLYKINPDNALEYCNRKFINRFNYIEQELLKEGKEITAVPLEEKEALWQKSKEQNSNSD